MRHQVTIEPGALSVAAFCQWAGVSRAWTYQKLREGSIRSVKRGGRRLIPMDAAREWLAGDREAA